MIASSQTSVDQFTFGEPKNIGRENALRLYKL
jgi:hypothetical protein